MPRPKHSDPQLPERIAHRLRQVRLGKGWTQEYLAEVLDVATETVSRYEVGRVPPSLPMLYRMAKVLGVDVQWLLGIEPVGPASAETELVEGWRALDTEAQSMVLNLVRRLHRGSNRSKPAAQAGAIHAPPSEANQK